MVNIDIVLDSFFDIYKLCRAPVIVVCQNTSDYPDKFVARLWTIHNKPTKYVMVKDSLKGIRDNIPLTMCRFERSPQDDPVIIESWL